MIDLGIIKIAMIICVSSHGMHTKIILSMNNESFCIYALGFQILVIFEKTFISKRIYKERTFRLERTLKNETLSVDIMRSIGKYIKE